MSADTRTVLGRRHLLGGLGAATLGTRAANPASVKLDVPGGAHSGSAAADRRVLNQVLRTKYFQATFCSHAVHGRGLDRTDTAGRGKEGIGAAPPPVAFRTAPIEAVARDGDALRRRQVRELRSSLGPWAMAQSRIDLCETFRALAARTGIVPDGAGFDPFLNERNYLVSAFLVERIGLQVSPGLLASVSPHRLSRGVEAIPGGDGTHAESLRVMLVASGLASYAEAVARSTTTSSLIIRAGWA